MNPIERWLQKEAPRKPLLVWGPLQSGKKTIIRRILGANGYAVWEPTSKDLAIHVDSGIKGKHAYIMRMGEVKTKVLPNVKRAPVVYVCHSPYGYGLTKAELALRFEMHEMKTGKDYSKESSGLAKSSMPDLRFIKDTEHNFWESLDLINNINKTAVKMAHAQRAGDYFPEVIYNSYLAQGSSMEDIAIVAESMSFADVHIPHWDDEYNIALNVIFPIKKLGITSQKLVVQKPKTKQTFSGVGGMYGISTLEPKKDPEEKESGPSKKREAKPKTKRAPKKRKS
jgi:hypothetical protein